MEVTSDGEVRQVADLEAGMTIRLTTGRQSAPVETSVAAPDLKQDCAHLHTRQTISRQGEPGMRQFAIPPDTESVT